jgi:uncharacterized protein
MSPILRFMVPLVLAGWLGSGAEALAAVPRVNDEAKMFSAESVEKANQKIKQIADQFRVDLLIETLPGIPANLQERYKQQGKAEFFRRWADERAAVAGVKGIYILITKQPAHLQIEVDKATRKAAFTLDDRNRLVGQMTDRLRKRKPDEALLEAANFVYSTLQAHGGGRAPAAGGRTAAAPPVSHSPGPGARQPHVAGPDQDRGGIGWLGWLAIGVGIFLVLWLLFGLFRALTGAGRGAYGGAGPGGGYGPGGSGGGYGGGGGGGFLTSLMGGLFGAAAGSWIYDSFFRSGGSHLGESSAYGGTPTSAPSADVPPSEQPGAGVFGDDTGGGGDFDDNGGGGGDFAEDPGGGGDWGGGDFGGGDFGGGDFGGGGDWA